jgi:hypothetical protein
MSEVTYRYDNNGVLTSDENNIFAMHVNHGNESIYYGKVDANNNLKHPDNQGFYGPASTRGKPDRLIQVSHKGFELYLSFLQSRNKVALRNANRSK